MAVWSASRVCSGHNSRSRGSTIRYPSLDCLEKLMGMLGRRLPSDLVSFPFQIWSLSLRVHSMTRETHPPTIKTQLMYVSSVWPPRHVILERSGTALDGITEVTEHKKGEVTLAWRILWYRILIEEWDALSIEGCEATSQARHMARECPFPP